QLSFEQEFNIRHSLENIINNYSGKNVKQLSLNDLLEYGNNIDINELKIKYANITLNNLLILNAKRINRLRELPYFILLNPYISLSYNLYLKSFELLIKIGEITNINQIDEFLEKLNVFLTYHSNNIPTLSQGFKEILSYYPKDKASNFLDLHLRDRILMKLIALNYSYLINPPNSSNIGIIDLKLNINKIIQRCEEFVNDICQIKYFTGCKVEIISNNDELDTDNSDNSDNAIANTNNDILFPFVYSNLEYCFTEILKNSFRAHIENKVDSDIPIQITIIKNYEITKDENDPTKITSKIPILEVRIRDVGGGIQPDIEKHIYDFNFTTFKDYDNENDFSERAVAGMGYGLGLSRNYIEMFGGSFKLQTYWGWGTDVYITVKG
ncbi:alpha-ketoacid dehydrogenase kinase family protein, partial [Ascoidea rubescens DSM 1968]